MPVRRVDADDVHSPPQKLLDPLLPPDTLTAAPTRKPAEGVLAGVGVLRDLQDVLDRDEPLEVVRPVHHEELLDPVLVEYLAGLVERRPHRDGDQSSFVITLRIGCSKFVSNRRSRLVRIPTSFPSRVTGSPEIRYFFITSRASMTRWSGSTVIGSEIMPLSDSLTRSTSVACSSAVLFRWMIPIPPSRAMGDGGLRLRDRVHRGATRAGCSAGCRA